MVDPADHTVAELEEELESIDDPDALEAMLEDEKSGKDRKTAKAAIESRLEKVRDADGDDASDEETGDEGAEEAGDEDAEEDDEVGGEDAEEEGEADEEDDGLTHPTADKRHVRALKGGTYRDVWVYCETQQGELLDVSKEMLGKAHELMDQYAEDYGDDERVVAVVVGDDCEELAEECIAYGADVAVYHEDERLERFLHKPYTEIVAHMARGAGEFSEGDWHDYDEPRYFLYPATNNGRDISAQVQAELDSGLASDCSGLYIEESLVSNPVKTGEPGKKIEFERVLHMKRPDFSGFEYSTILCLDNPERDFHPQGASVIPGSFDALDPDPNREGLVVEHDIDLPEEWFPVTVSDWDTLDEGIDLARYDVVVCLGRGIGDDPTRGIELGLELADAFEDAALGITRGIVTSSYQFEGHVEQYTREERQIGETGQFLDADLYIGAGVSGAVQHKVGMDDSDTIVAINTDPDASIRDFSDYFIEGDLFEVLPRLTEGIKRGELDLEAAAGGED